MSAGTPGDGGTQRAATDGLVAIAFVAGACTLVVEPAAVRLLAPWFGASAGVWTNVIGVILLALSLGYLLGARWAAALRPDRPLALVLLLGGLFSAWLDHTNTVPVIDTSTYTVIDSVQMPTGETNVVTIHPDFVMEDIFINPPEQAKDGGRGETVAYQETLFNNSGVAETFTLEARGNAWQTQLSASQIGPVPSGETANFTVIVTVPDDAPWYATDSATILATGVTSPALTAAAQITTTAYAAPQISVSPAALTGTLYTNGVATQTLNISNGYGVTLTYAINVGGGFPRNFASLHLDEPQGSTSTPALGPLVACGKALRNALPPRPAGNCLRALAGTPDSRLSAAPPTMATISPTWTRICSA